MFGLRTRGIAVALTAAAMLAAAAGCGGGTDESPSRPGDGPGGSPPRQGRERNATVVPSRCPAGVAGCRMTEGRIVYVERVDPDGDGDAHFVIADPQGITLPGLTAIDVRRGCAPTPCRARAS